MMTTDLITLREMKIRYEDITVDSHPVLLITSVRAASDLGPTLVTLLQPEVAEVFGIVCLSTKCQPIAYHEVSRGTLDSIRVHPREVFKAALLANSASIIVAHNHPSGDPTPSRKDVLITQRLIEVGHVVGVPVVDHLVIGHGRWVSLRASGLLT